MFLFAWLCSCEAGYGLLFDGVLGFGCVVVSHMGVWMLFIVVSIMWVACIGSWGFVAICALCSVAVGVALECFGAGVRCWLLCVCPSSVVLFVCVLMCDLRLKVGVAL